MNLRFYAQKFSKSHGKHIKEVPKHIMKALEDYAWPGNVRELMNVIERAVIVSDGPHLRLAEKIDAIPSAHQEETIKMEVSTGPRVSPKWNRNTS